MSESDFLLAPAEIDRIVEAVAHEVCPVEILRKLCADVVRDLASERLDLARDAGDLPSHEAIEGNAITGLELVDRVGHLQTEYWDTTDDLEKRAIAVLQQSAYAMMRLECGEALSFEDLQPILLALHARANARLCAQIAQNRLRLNVRASIAGQKSARVRRERVRARNAEIFEAWNELNSKKSAGARMNAPIGILARSGRWKGDDGETPLSARQIERIVDEALLVRNPT